ncbi:uncharacterized protein LOC111650621 [Seriola lalandi dorsalis]|uniref:uncharacterized protein LOC111650621 n=1 Tax=Seriola lalandi dorsalis TaxID=1841481 RepID=UPI000C6F76D9|nr:uncharacterized protein LOC111650621 [Seriola lalandi dorsalis]
MHFPDGTVITCSSSIDTSVKQMPLGASAPYTAAEPPADVYWVLLNTENNPLIEQFDLWAPWIHSLSSYHSVPDPPHCTLYYDRNEDWIYKAEFEDKIEGDTWALHVEGIYVGQEGVASAVMLPEYRKSWYKMSNTATPHISLALHAGHQAKELGPMVKKALTLTDWQPTQIPRLFISPSTHMYRIQYHTDLNGTCQHETLTRYHGRERTDGDGTQEMLQTLPDSLWSSGPFDVGFCKNVNPVTFSVQPIAAPIWQSQYKHKQEATDGIKPTIEGLLQAGVLRPSQSQWNTPILPVKKSSGTYRMAHDLRAINRIITSPVTPVPNPHAALAMLDTSHQFFSCIDLANAFFCLPLAPHLQDMFSFTYGGRRLTYTRMPQGFLLSPSIFNDILRAQLADLDIPDGCLVVQYVDDILVACPSPHTCLQLTRSILLRLHTCGYKVSKTKLQCCRASVTFLGREISGTGADMSALHKDSILNHPRPETVKDMLSFLGLTGYSRHFVPDYAGRTESLRALVKVQGCRNLSAKLDWTVEADSDFICLKQDLSQATSLAPPDYTQPFFLDVSERQASAYGVLYQKQRGIRRVLIYCSVLFDVQEKRATPCVRYAAAVAKLTEKIAHVVMHHPLIILTSHATVAFVTSSAFTLTPLRQSRILKVLTQPHITFVHQGINMAEQILEGTPHCCITATKDRTKVRTDLSETPLVNPEVEIYTDGCCFRHPDRGLQAGYAVVELGIDGTPINRKRISAEIRTKNSQSSTRNCITRDKDSVEVKRGTTEQPRNMACK